ncbi:MAG: hypothetical protein IT486_06640 [Gammaproteobacteria bacterium]|nr:hypothetical protein [Gammaproteobacteria bacterium]
MRGRQAEPVEFGIGYSPWPAIWAGLLGVLAGTVLAATALPPLARVLLVLGVVARLALGLHRIGAPTGSRVRRAVWMPGGDWQLELADDRRHAAQLRHVWGLAHGPVMAFEWRCGDGRCRRAWVGARTLDPVTVRRLRTRLALA